MANENENVLSANQGAPAADIPDLKKKEKERKKAGAAWSGARGAGSPFSGATGGTVARAAASAAAEGTLAEGAALGAVEAAEGGLGATLSNFLAGLTATLAGKIAVAAAAFLLLAGAGLVGYALLKGGGASVGAPNLGAITDSLKVRAGGGDRTAVASNGEIAFDPAKPNPPAKEEPKAEEKKDDKAVPDALDAKKPGDDAANGWAPQDKLAHNLSGAKLSSSLGGEFGGKNIFAGGGNAPKFGDALGKGGLPHFGAQKGKLAAMKGKAVRGTTTPRSIGKARTSRAIGQLKMAKGMSLLGASASNAEEAASNANGAFDQTATNGGGLNTPGGAHDTVTPPSSGGGAPDTTMPTAPAAPTGTTVNPNLQNAMDQIGKLADEARKMKQTGTMLIILGIALIALGISDLVPTFGASAVLIAIGGMLVGMGYMMIQMANMMADMAKAMGQMVAAQVGSYQGNIVNQCTDQALNGTAVANCQPTTENSDKTIQHVNDQDKTAMDRQKTISQDTPVITTTKAQ